MKGGGLCPDLSFNHQGTTFTPYRWGSDGETNMGFAMLVGTGGCGFFIEVGTPAEGETPRNDYFIDLEKVEGQDPNEKKKLKITKVAEQNSISKTIQKISSEQNEKLIVETEDPIETLKTVLGGDYKFNVLAYDESNGVLKYASFGQPEPVTEAPAPVVKTPEAPVVEAPKASVVKEITQLVSTENEKGVNVLKSIGHVVIKDVNPERVKEERNKGSERLHRSNIQNVLCKKISEGLNNDPDLTKEFNKTEADADLEITQNELKVQKQEAGWNSFSGLKTRFNKNLNEYNKNWGNFKNIFGMTDSTLTAENGITGPFQEMYKNLNNFETNMNQEFYDHLPNSKEEFENVAFDERMTTNAEFDEVLVKELQNPTSLNTDKIYNLVFAINKILIDINKKLIKYTKNYTLVNEAGIGRTSEKKLKPKMMGMLRNSIDQNAIAKDLNPNFPQLILKTYNSSGEIARSKLYNDSEDMQKTLKKQFALGRKNFGKSVRSTSLSDITKNRGILKGISSSMNSALQKGQQMAKTMKIHRQTPGTTGGKRKTRKNKARKTRRKVQRKRRQSKKH